MCLDTSKTHKIYLFAVSIESFALTDFEKALCKQLNLSQNKRQEWFKLRYSL
jgi:hypothetical protein